MRTFVMVVLAGLALAPALGCSNRVADEPQKDADVESPAVAADAPADPPTTEQRPKDLPPLPKETKDPPKAKVQDVSRFAGQWKDKWHLLTIEPNGRGAGSTDFGSWFDWNEFILRQEEGKFFADIAHPESGDRRARNFRLRLKDASTLELLGHNGKLEYTLTKQTPKPQTKLSELAGDWKEEKTYVEGANKQDLLDRFGKARVSIDAFGKGRLQFAKRTEDGDDSVKFQLQRKAKDSTFTIDRFEGKSWQLAAVQVIEDRPTLRLTSTDQKVRVYLFKMKSNGKKKT